MGLISRMILVVSANRAQVGRVSPRPQDRGRSYTLLGREARGESIRPDGAMVAGRSCGLGETRPTRARGAVSPP
jgi:hypothetical protein